MFVGKRIQRGERRNASRSIIPHARFTRLAAEVQVRRTPDGLPLVVQGRVFLHDLSPSGIGLFVEARFSRNEKIEVAISGEHPLYLRGTVMWCNPSHTSSRVIREHQFAFRIGAKLYFDDPAERKLVESYCRELAIRRDPRTDASEQRIDQLTSAIFNFCIDGRANLWAALELQPSLPECIASFKAVELRMRGEGVERYNQRLDEAREILADRFGYVF